MPSNNSNNNKKKKSKSKKEKSPVKVNYVSCVNADDPSLAQPVEVVTKIQRAVWDQEVGQYENLDE